MKEKEGFNKEHKNKGGISLSDTKIGGIVKNFHRVVFYQHVRTYQSRVIIDPGSPSRN